MLPWKPCACRVSLFNLWSRGAQTSLQACDLLQEAIVAAHPVGVQKIGGAGLHFAPELQLFPGLTVGGAVRAPRSTGDDSPRSPEQRLRPRNPPAVHGWLAGLASIRGTDQLVRL